MASPASVYAVENIIGYNFRSRRDLLLKALTAAGATQEDWDGNRKLAQFGTGLSEFLLNYLAYEAEATRAHANDFKSSVTNNEQRASITKRTGISRHIKYSEKEGAQSPSVLSKAFNAIVGAVFLDSEGNVGVVLRTMWHLGVFNLAGQPINPMMLSLDEYPESLDVTSLARSLFRCDVGSHLPSVMSSNDQTPGTCSSIRLPRTIDPDHAAPGTSVSTGIDYDGRCCPAPYNDVSWTEEFSMDMFVDLSPDNSIHNACSEVDGGEAPSEYHTFDAAPQHREPMNKRISMHESESTRRKKPRGCDVHWNVDMFKPYLTEEYRKCEAVRHQLPQDTFLTPTIQKAILDLGKGKTEVLARILVQIASPCLIGGLQEILNSCRTQESCTALKTSSTLLRTERFRLIASLGHTMSHTQLLRRYHIHELFKDCGGAGASTCGLTWMAPSDFGNRLIRRGNPANRSVADLTAKMMEEAFADIDPSTAEYVTKYRWISDIRRLGQRLDMLETRFGKGILGLMLDQGLPGTDVGITDLMIMAPTDAEYARFVDILNDSQGDLLRDLSTAILPAVQALIDGSLHQQRLFKIENITVSNITKYPKGSSTFLELIRETTKI